MKAYVKTPKNLSRAMYRVANALEQFAPDDIQIVDREDDADLLVLHVIGLEAVDYRRDKKVAVMQYCTGAGQRTMENMAPWFPLWDRAVVIWSYYDLNPFIPFDSKFYHAPLGIDRPFRQQAPEGKRDYMVLTSGYVNGRPQEAIQEPTEAAWRVHGGRPLHLGKIPVGMTKTMNFNLAHDVTDTQLVELYRRCRWVAGLRYTEGFELGVIEGLAQGARPVVFDRPDNRYWFKDLAAYIPEVDGDELTDKLTELFYFTPAEVTPEEKRWLLDTFNWKTLVTKFWNLVKERS